MNFLALPVVGGGETLVRANSMKGKLSGEIAERARRLRGDEKKRAEEAE